MYKTYIFNTDYTVCVCVFSTVSITAELGTCECTCSSMRVLVCCKLVNFNMQLLFPFHLTHISGLIATLCILFLK